MLYHAANADPSLHSCLLVHQERCNRYPKILEKLIAVFLRFLKQGVKNSSLKSHAVYWMNCSSPFLYEGFWTISCKWHPDPSSSITDVQLYAQSPPHMRTDVGKRNGQNGKSVFRGNVFSACSETNDRHRATQTSVKPASALEAYVYTVTPNFNI